MQSHMSPVKWWDGIIPPKAILLLNPRLYAHDERSCLHLYLSIVHRVPFLMFIFVPMAKSQDEMFLFFQNSTIVHSQIVLKMVLKRICQSLNVCVTYLLWTFLCVSCSLTLFYQSTMISDVRVAAMSKAVSLLHSLHCSFASSACQAVKEVSA